MAHGPDIAAGWLDVAKNLHDPGRTTGEKCVSPALFRSGKCFAVHSVLSLRTRCDSQSVSLLSSLHAAPLGWNRAITGNLYRWEETRRLPPLVCALVRAP